MFPEFLLVRLYFASLLVCHGLLGLGATLHGSATAACSGPVRRRLLGCHLWLRTEAAEPPAQREAAQPRRQIWIGYGRGVTTVQNGSGQQSVTGVTSVDDGNSYWRIRGKMDTVCERGTAIRCGQVIRITHVNTGRNLHSHHFTSPLSGNQEVSAFGDGGEGDYLDDWTVLCDEDYWERDSEVRFQHTATDVYLSITGEQYGRPINGQREVHGMISSNQNNYWKAMEGIFMKPSEQQRTDLNHSEL